MLKLNYIVLSAIIVVAIGVGGLIGYKYLEGLSKIENNGYDSEFDSELSSFAPGRIFDDKVTFPPNIAASRSGSDSIIEFYGPASLYSRDTFEIEPNSVYSVSTRIRVTRDDPKRQGAETYVGLVPYDAAGKEIELPRGAFLYPVLAGKVLTAAEGWKEFEGRFSLKSGSPFQLPPDTASVRLLIFANLESPDAITQADYLRFAEAK